MIMRWDWQQISCKGAYHVTITKWIIIQTIKFTITKWIVIDKYVLSTSLHFLSTPFSFTLPLLSKWAHILKQSLSLSPLKARLFSHYCPHSIVDQTALCIHVGRRIIWYGRIRCTCSCLKNIPNRSFELGSLILMLARWIDTY